MIDDLTGSDEERSNLYRLIISKLEEYTGFFVFEYYTDINKVKLETEEILDSIINILLNYLDEEVDKINYKKIIQSLIDSNFYSNQPTIIKTQMNDEVLKNHYLFYLKRKLSLSEILCK